MTPDNASIRRFTLPIKETPRMHKKRSISQISSAGDSQSVAPGSEVAGSHGDSLTERNVRLLQEQTKRATYQTEALTSYTSELANSYFSRTQAAVVELQQEVKMLRPATGTPNENRKAFENRLRAVTEKLERVKLQYACAGEAEANAYEYYR